MLVNRVNMEPRWTETETSRLESDISRFKQLATSLFREYQSSQRGNLKYLLLDHIPADIRRIGSLKVGDAGLFE